LKTLAAALALSFTACSLAQDKPTAALPADTPRVFITDSESWSIAGSSGGSGGTYGGAMAGGARPQTAEIIKTFGERCPNVKVNNKQDRADYVVLLDHEGGKGLLRHKNKVAVFNRVSGDSITSKSTLSLGGSVQEACEAITRDWSEHGTAIRAASVATPEKSTPVVPVATPVAVQFPPPSCRSTPLHPVQISRWTAILWATLLLTFRSQKAIIRSLSRNQDSKTGNEG
jgi:hypothetical protein